ncbi:MAG: tetratricopeptide repeat protein [Xanthobacteraceae bacterium]
MWRGSRAWWLAVWCVVGLLAPEIPGAAAQNVKADVSVSTSAGYARVVFNFSEDVESAVRLSNNVLVISFKKPVDVAVDRIATSSDYFSAARRDPDGGGVRIALKQKLRANSMVAGERLFVDLLPESWTGDPPSLPQEVIEDLSKRMREAEKRVREQKALEREKVIPTSRVRISNQPTFTRYIFELPELVSVNANRAKDKLTLTFGTPLKFDLGDVKVMQPPLVEALDVKIEDNATTVSFSFVGTADVRNFREDNNYVVDVLNPDTAAKVEEGAAPALSQKTQEVPLVSAPSAPAPEKAASASGARSDISRMRAVAEPAAVKPLEQPQRPAPPINAVAASPATALTAPPSENAPSESTSAHPQAEVAPAPGASVESQNSEATAVQAAPAAEASAPVASITATVRRQGEGFQLTFPFGEPVAAAVFARTDSLWLIFDATKLIDLGAIKGEGIRGATVEQRDDYQIVRVKLDRPRLVNANSEGAVWTIDVGDVATRASQPLAILRSVVVDKRTSVQIPLEDAKNLRRVADPEVGDDLSVITALGPPRGLTKTQDFVDFRALASTHGLVVQSLADDLAIDLGPDRVRISRPKGLTLTSSSPTGRRNGSLRPAIFDTQQWGFDREAEFPKRSRSLMNAAAQSPEARRNGARMDLARFYFARDMYPEAKAVLDFALQEDRPTPEDTIGLVMRGVANLMMDRPEDALKDLTNPMVGNQNDAPLWRAVAFAKQGKWPDAREGLRAAEAAIAALPVELQQEIFTEAIRASVEVRDFSAAETQLKELESLGSTSQLDDIPVLQGRVYEGLGQNNEALESYRAAAGSQNRALAAQGRMREIALRYRLGDMARGDVVTALETLTAIWRGDATEAEALQLLAKLYIEDGRYREAFNLMRIAVRAHPDSEITRRIQDDAAAAFDVLFLGGKGDALPPIEALSLFYDFRDLTPIGRRGDEMIRRLADRLISVDLLDQAAELLQHQIEHRLQGAARAQVATRLAVVHLLNRKPERALQVLKSTRMADLSQDLRNQRLMLEARALSDVGRHGLAFDVVQNLPGPEAARLRSDILWAGKQYRESAEQIEMLYADRFREWTPLTDVERRDILRAGISYALAEDTIGLDRFREKFGPMMAQGAEQKAFAMVTTPLSVSKPEFQEVVKSIAAVDTLQQFVRDMRTRFPDSAMPVTPGNAEAPQTRLMRPDRSATGALPETILR